jgi:hypothetical protein
VKHLWKASVWLSVGASTVVVALAACSSTSPTPKASGVTPRSTTSATQSYRRDDGTKLTGVITRLFGIASPSTSGRVVSGAPCDHPSVLPFCPFVWRATADGRKIAVSGGPGQGLDLTRRQIRLHGRDRWGSHAEFRNLASEGRTVFTHGRPDCARALGARRIRRVQPRRRNHAYPVCWHRGSRLASSEACGRPVGRPRFVSQCDGRVRCHLFSGPASVDCNPSRRILHLEAPRSAARRPFSGMRGSGFSCRRL